MEISFHLAKTVKIVNWKVNEGNSVHQGNVIFDYIECGKDGEDLEPPAPRLKFKANKSGVVRKILAPKGSVIKNGTPLLTLGPFEQCTHPIVVHDMCADCSQDLQKLRDPLPNFASVAMVHSVPGLKVSMEEAQILGKQDEQHLLKERKLVLLVDLDQTLIHTTNDNVPQNLEDVFHFQLINHGTSWYHTRLRPGTRTFLKNISSLYQLHICTFGTRQYANYIAHFLDPQKTYFSDRILSRDECFSHNSKTANLKELFPRGDHMVCIIDDREDVWSFAKNLIHVKPYHFFKHTGDINAPPGLTKNDDDDKVGIEFPNDIDKTSISSSGSESNNKTINESKTDNNENPTANDEKESDSTTTTTTAGTATSNTVVKTKKKKYKKTPNARETDDVSEDIESDTTESEPRDNESELDNPSDIIAAETEPENDSGAVKETNEESKEEEHITTSEATEIPKDPEKESIEVTTTTESQNGKQSLETTIADQESGQSTVITETTTTTVTPSEMVNEKENNENKVDTTSPISPDPDIIPRPKTPDIAGKAEDNIIKVEDPDDYLLYLEEILRRIHQAYYDLYDEMLRKGETSVPDVKNVIPYVRKKVLKGSSLVFSGVFPTHIELENSDPYKIAVGLGAHVSSKIIPPPKPGSHSRASEPPTTHVVAARLGTAKVNEARRYKGIHIVSPDWLWCCAERWTHVDENLFLLCKQSSVKRNPPPHCSSPEQPFKEKSNKEVDFLEPLDDSDTSEITNLPGPSSSSAQPSSSKGNPAGRKLRTPSGRFMDTINPLLTFSMDEMESMEHEVDDIFKETDSSSSSSCSEEGGERTKKSPRRKKIKLSHHNPEELSEERVSISKSLEDEDDSSSTTDEEDTETESENPLGNSILGKRRRSPSPLRTETETEDEPLSARFRRGEPLPSDLDPSLLSGSSDDEDDNELNDQDDDWMAEALEREFLDENSQD